MSKVGAFVLVDQKIANVLNTLDKIGLQEFILLDDGFVEHIKDIYEIPIQIEENSIHIFETREEVKQFLLDYTNGDMLLKEEETRLEKLLSRLQEEKLIALYYC